MRYLFLLCSLSYASDEYTIQPCIPKLSEECLEDDAAIEALQDQNPDCFVEEANFEGVTGGQCCYDLVVSKCGGGCGGS